MTYQYELVGGERLEAGDVRHLLVLGGGRSEDGMDMSPGGRERAIHAARFFEDMNLLDKGGVIVNSGYKTPAEPEVASVHIPELARDTVGVPESVAADRLMEELGIPKKARRIEADSFETVTNHAYSRALFPDLDNTEPVGIVSHSEHLERVIGYIAPRTLHRPFVGIVVPETSPRRPAKGSRAAHLFSRAVLLGINPDTPNLESIVTTRARLGWQAIIAAQRLVGQKPNYNPGASASHGS